MKLEIKRVILFASDVSGLGTFYRDVLGLQPRVSPDDPRKWLEGRA